MKLNKKGFSLMELLIVVIIITGFAAFVYPSFVSSLEHSRASEAVNMLGTIQALQQKNFVTYESYALKFQDINDFTPTIKGFNPDTTFFYSEYFKYELGGTGVNKVSATRVDKNHNTLDKGYSFEAKYAEDFIRCNFSNDNGERVCASLTDKNKSGSMYPIY